MAPESATNISDRLGVWPVPGEKGRFHVRADSKHPPYLVDMLAYHGAGKCGCPDFLFNRELALKEGTPPGPGVSCKHIERVLWFIWLVAVFPKMNQGEGHQNDFHHQSP